MTRKLKIVLFVSTILTSVRLFGQTNKYVEEIALYHLDSLTKVDPVFKEFKYFTNGYVEKLRTDIDDTLFIMSVKPDLSLKTPFKNLVVVADTTIKLFAIPRRLRKNGGSDALSIFHFLKIGQEYFVLFKIELKDGGQMAVIIMDEKGNLKRRKIGHYIY